MSSLLSLQSHLLSKSILERQVLVERKVCFIPVASNRGERWTHVQRPTPPHPSISGWELFKGSFQGVWTEEWGLFAETVQAAVVGILNWSRGALIVLGAVSFQFQGQFVSISLRPVLRTTWHHVVNFFHMVGVSVFTRQLKGWLRILSVALKEDLKAFDLVNDSTIIIWSCLTACLYL